MKERRKSDADRLVDDMQAVKADMESGDPKLMAHAFGAMASIMTEIASKCDGVPGLSRMRRMLLENAEDALARKDDIERAETSRRLWRAAFDREELAAAKRRETNEETNQRVGQADLFAPPPSPGEEK